MSTLSNPLFFWKEKKSHFYSALILIKGKQKKINKMKTFFCCFQPTEEKRSKSNKKSINLLETDLGLSVLFGKSSTAKRSRKLFLFVLIEFQKGIKKNHQLIPAYFSVEINLFRLIADFFTIKCITQSMAENVCESFYVHNR